MKRLTFNSVDTLLDYVNNHPEIEVISINTTDNNYSASWYLIYIYK